METYTKEQMLEVGRRFHEMKDLTKKEADEVILEFISTLPVSSVKDKEPDCDNENCQLFGLNKQGICCKTWKLTYSTPVPSNRIGDAEYEKYLELKKSYVKPLSDESIITDLEMIIRRETGCNYNYSNDASKAVFEWLKSLVSPVSDEVKKPIEEITDEDAIECSGLIGGAGHLSDTSKIFQFKELFSSPNFHTKQTNISGNNWLKAFQYLQSKNYQLPKYY